VGIPLLVIIGVGFCVAIAAIAVFSGTLGQKTCRECGGGLPVTRLSNSAHGPALDDWVCSKCGTRFDRQARART